MRTWRYGLIAAGIIHDAVLSPLIVGIGWLLARFIPPGGRRYVQSALIIGGLIGVIALPMIYRQGSQPPNKAQLLQNYAANLAILLAVVATLNLIAYAAATIREHRHPRGVAAEQ